MNTTLCHSSESQFVGCHCHWLRMSLGENEQKSCLTNVLFYGKRSAVSIFKMGTEI